MRSMLFGPCFFLLVLLSVYALASWPIFVGADTPPSPRATRLSGLDGLRGILAIAVVVHHAALFRADRATGGTWIEPQFFQRIGPGAVAMFFMITGFLFWSIVLRERGRPVWLALYAGRVLRIGPVYLVAVCCLFVAVGFKTKWQAHVPSTVLAHEVIDWTLLGMHAPVALNGDTETWRLLGVAWSLRYEWIFYALLPLVALAARSACHLPIVTAGLVLSGALAHRHAMDGFFPSAAMAAFLFLIGMTISSLHARGFIPQLRSDLLSIVMLLLLAAALARPEPYAVLSAVWLGLAFFLVTIGADIFGLLRSRVARRVGDVSYGIYLMHLLVLQALLHIPALAGFFIHSTAVFWVTTAVSGCAVFAIAAALHVTVERPGIAIGRRLIRTRSTQHRTVGMNSSVRHAAER